MLKKNATGLYSDGTREVYCHHLQENQQTDHCPSRYVCLDELVTGLVIVYVWIVPICSA